MNYSDFEDLFNKDYDGHVEKYNEAVTNIINKNSIKKAVFGMDIYRYSKLSTNQQALVPYLLDKLLEITIEDIIMCEPAFFDESFREDIQKTKIGTGDGYYLFFDDPLRAIFFAIYFNANILMYNTLNRDVEIFSILKDLSIRYAITYNNVYLYNNMYYGNAIIDNARILSLDKLNRFLIEKNTYTWFMRTINGLETLPSLVLKDLIPIKTLRINDKKESYLFTPINGIVYKIRDLIVQKIGIVQAKEDNQDIYSIYLQTLIRNGKAIDLYKLIVSIGNLNTSGIADH
jgi:hypothetical protein